MSGLSQESAYELAAAHQAWPRAVRQLVKALGGYFNEEQGCAWPSVERLALAADRSVRTVRRWLPVAEAVGAVMVRRRRWGRRQGTSQYFLPGLAEIIARKRALIAAGKRQRAEARAEAAREAARRASSPPMDRARASAILSAMLGNSQGDILPPDSNNLFLPVNAEERRR